MMSAINNVISFAEEKGGFAEECAAARTELALLNAEMRGMKATLFEARQISGSSADESLCDRLQTLCVELADLRSSVATLMAQNAEQVRQLEAARTAIYDAINHHGGGTKLLRDWLAANPAPEPQAEQERSSDG